MTLTLQKSLVSLAGWPFALQRPCFCTWKDDICERPGFKFVNSIWQPYFNIAEMQSDCSVILWSAKLGYSLWRLKPKKGTLQKQLRVKLVYPIIFFKKSLFYLHLKDQLIYWLKHFDCRNTYLWHPWQVLRVTGSTENPVRGANSVDARTIDAREDLQGYCTANKCNSIKKWERVTLK